MSGMKKGGMALVLASGIVETIVAFVAYWVFYGIAKANSMSLVTPMVILLSGLLGGILAIIGAVLIKSTRIGGPVLSMVAAGLQLFATLFLIVQASSTQNIGDAAMIILPFFILPNALGIAGATMALIPPKDQTAAPNKPEEK